MRKLSAVVSVAALASFTACGDGGGGGGNSASAIQASCSGPSFCDDVEGLSSQDLAIASSTCGAQGYAWASSACPGAGRVGTCVRDLPPSATGMSATFVLVQRIYDMALADAVNICASLGGTWTPG